MTDKQKADMRGQLTFEEDEYMELSTLVVTGAFGVEMVMRQSDGEVIDCSFKEESDPYRVMFEEGIKRLISEEEKAPRPCPDRLGHLRSLI